jgi:hypothetical protein
MSNTNSNLDENLNNWFDMLSIIVNDALDGVDIVGRYPGFYRQMLAHPELHQAFVDALSVLEMDAAGQLSPFPVAPEFGFLQSAAAPDSARDAASSTITLTAPHRWRIRWQQSLTHLQELLFPPGAQLAYRDATTYLEESSYQLLRSDVQIDDQPLEVLLEATLTPDAPDFLQLQLWIAGEMDPQRRSKLQTSLEWGDYRATAPVDGYGHARFPPAHLDALLDAETQTFKSALDLVLETTGE